MKGFKYSTEKIFWLAIKEIVMFAELKQIYTYYGQKSLFLSSSVRLRANSHKRYIKVLANWAAWFTTGLFCFGYLPDSGANDPRPNLAQGSVLRGAVGETRLKGAVPVTRECRSTMGAIRVGGIADSIFLGGV